jgi:hypothetical protein
MWKEAVPAQFEALFHLPVVTEKPMETCQDRSPGQASNRASQQPNPELLLLESACAVTAGTCKLENGKGIENFKHLMAFLSGFSFANSASYSF